MKGTAQNRKEGMDWHRRHDEDGECYYVEHRGRYMIDKKITDDREYDGGYLVTEWILHERISTGYYPIQGYPRLSDAKAEAERFQS